MSFGEAPPRSRGFFRSRKAQMQDPLKVGDHLGWSLGRFRDPWGTTSLNNMCKLVEMGPCDSLKL